MAHIQTPLPIPPLCLLSSLQDLNRMLLTSMEMANHAWIIGSLLSRALSTALLSWQDTLASFSDIANFTRRSSSYPSHNLMCLQPVCNALRGYISVPPAIFQPAETPECSYIVLHSSALNIQASVEELSATLSPACASSRIYPNAKSPQNSIKMDGGIWL